MSSPSKRDFAKLPPTVNLHLVAQCNMRCRYCFAHFHIERQEGRLPVEHVETVMNQLAQQGVRRVTIAGGEPTLHPRLLDLLRHAGRVGLVTSIVTNGSLIDRTWIEKHGPYLRWLTLSVDSVDAARSRILGRHTGSASYRHPEHLVVVANLVHAWNASRPRKRQIQLKLNITVTSSNVDEDPRPFIARVRPSKVKVLQMLVVLGENDGEGGLGCSAESFAGYARRLQGVPGVEVVREDTEAMDGSYAMVDPLGRFYQRVQGKYVRSEPIHQVGVMSAWAAVGGFDSERFVARGGDYEPGAIADGNLPFLIAIEGLDGIGKSTITRRLAEQLGGRVVSNPPAAMVAERPEADRGQPGDRRAWYLLGNQMAAKEADGIRQREGVPVVMDRSVASTLAFGAAESGTDVAPWPAGIPRPDLLVMLSVPEPERQRRISRRGLERSLEEHRLDRDPEFRAAVLRNYKALGATEVDAAGTVEDVVARIIDLIRR